MREQIRQQLGRGWCDLKRRLRQTSSARRRLLSAVLVLGVVGLAGVVAALPRITSASETSVLANGGFEHGFVQIPGCGIVGAQWNCFTNGGAANYGFYDDQWEEVVAEGKHSQLIEISTENLAAADADRYAGIYQTARVVKGRKYQFSMRGMIRTTNKEGDPWRYRVQVGYLNGPHGDWEDVENWTDVGWNSYYGRTEPSAFSSFSTQLVPDSDVITVFIRVWKKWGVAYEELDVNLDAIELTGPSPQMAKGPGPDGPFGGPPVGGTGGPVGSAGMPMGPGPMDEWDRVDRNQPLVCNGQDLVYNGSFEQGFNRTPLGEVGRGWGAFTNGGAVAYGFYDEEWDPVVADGKHGQLIEISSKGIYPTDADRYAGIYQKLEGLHPGAVYELTLRGLLRGEGNEDDPFRFAAQWAVGSSPDWSHVDDDDWEEMDLGPISKRTEPGSMATYTARFKAPSQNAVLFIRGWKKWAITDVEMDFNLDAIHVRGCTPAGGQPGGWMPEPGKGPQQDMGPSQGPGPGDRPETGASCIYIVKPGDSLGRIAEEFGVTMRDIMRANGVSDPDMIYVGQKFEIPGCSRGGRPEEPMPMPMARPEGPQRPAGEEPMVDRRPDNERTYTVRGGDSLGLIAAQVGVNVYELARYNGIDNMNVILVGQVLRIPS